MIMLLNMLLLIQFLIVMIASNSYIKIKQRSATTKKERRKLIIYSFIFQFIFYFAILTVTTYINFQ